MGFDLKGWEDTLKMRPRNTEVRTSTPTGILAAALLSSSICICQQPPAPVPVPDAPAPQPTTQTAPTPAPNDEEQSKRIMGVLPNFRSVSAGTTAPKQTAKEKLKTATLDNFDYTALFFAGWIAADSFVTKATPEFHQGAAGYARYYWHTVADQSIENYMVELIVPAMTHEDSRYFAMGKEGGGFMKRTEYALSRVVVTRTEAGKETFNVSEVAGSAAAAGISSLYYPSAERTAPKVLRNWGLDVTYDAVAFEFHEFWPDIRKLVFGHFEKKPHAIP